MPAPDQNEAKEVLVQFVEALSDEQANKLAEILAIRGTNAPAAEEDIASENQPTMNPELQEARENIARTTVSAFEVASNPYLWTTAVGGLAVAVAGLAWDTAKFVGVDLVGRTAANTASAFIVESSRLVGLGSFTSKYFPNIENYIGNKEKDATIMAHLGKATGSVTGSILGGLAATALTPLIPPASPFVAPLITIAASALGAAGGAVVGGTVGVAGNYVLDKILEAPGRVSGAITKRGGKFTERLVKKKEQKQNARSEITR